MYTWPSKPHCVNKVHIHPVKTRSACKTTTHKNCSIPVDTGNACLSIILSPSAAAWYFYCICPVTQQLCQDLFCGCFVLLFFSVLVFCSPILALIPVCCSCQFFYSTWSFLLIFSDFCENTTCIVSFLVSFYTTYCNMRNIHLIISDWIKSILFSFFHRVLTPFTIFSPFFPHFLCHAAIPQRHHYWGGGGAAAALFWHAWL